MEAPRCGRKGFRPQCGGRRLPPRKRPAMSPERRSLLLESLEDLLLGRSLADRGEERHAAHVRAGDAGGRGRGGNEQVGIGALRGGLAYGALRDGVLAAQAVVVEQVLDLGLDGRGRGDARAAGDDDLLYEWLPFLSALCGCPAHGSAPGARGRSLPACRRHCKRIKHSSTDCFIPNGLYFAANGECLLFCTLSNSEFVHC